MRNTTFDVVMSPLTNLLLESLKGYGNINLVKNDI